jgi:hypothetical protein
MSPLTSAASLPTPLVMRGPMPSNVASSTQDPPPQEPARRGHTHSDPTDRAPSGLTQRRVAAWIRDLDDLLARRPELTGVYALADLALESMRSSA